MYLYAYNILLLLYWKISYFFSHRIVSFFSIIHPFLLAAPNALLVAAVVKYALWPQLLKEGGPSRTERFKEPTTLIQHNANAIYVLAEVGLMGRLPVLMHHVCVAPLFGK